MGAIWRYNIANSIMIRKPMQHIRQEFMDSILNLDELAAKQVLERCTKGASSMYCIEEVIVPVMESIGEAWDNGDVALSQVYMGGRICEELVDILLPPESNLRKSQPNIALVVFNDHHTLGKRIVYTYVRAAGYELKDYGIMNDAQSLFNAIKRDRIEALLISVLMLHSALKIKELTDMLKKEGYALKLIVGGAPFRFDPDLYKEIGADAMASNASEIPQILEQLTKENV